MFVGVPRVWEKIKDHIDSVAREAHGIKESILTKARVRDLCVCVWVGVGS